MFQPLLNSLIELKLLHGWGLQHRVRGCYFTKPGDLFIVSLVDVD